MITCSHRSQFHLNAWTRCAVAQEPHANLCMLCTACFQCLKTDFVGSTNTINICLILSLYTFLFLSDSGCVCRGPSALLCQGAYNAVKTALKGVRNYIKWVMGQDCCAMGRLTVNRIPIDWRSSHCQ